MPDKKLYNYFNEIGIKPYSIVKHPAICTMKEADDLEIRLDGEDNINLFLRSKKSKKYYLITMGRDKRLNFKGLEEIIGVKRLTFAKDTELEEHLGVSRGAVTPMGLINDKENIVELYMDLELKNSEKMSFHPNINTATITISNSDFQRFISSLNKEINWIKL